MEAVVTMKATPAQFDILREALATAKTVYETEMDDTTLTSGTRREARHKAAECADVLERLRS